jgi:hypothetical protein
MYSLLKPMLILLRRFSPESVLTTQIIGEAMLNAVRRGVPHAILAPANIYRLTSSPV